MPLVSRCHGMKPPGSAGVPPAQILAQPRPSPRPGSTGNGARALLRPGPCGSRRQGGRLPNRGETERQAKGEDAGGTPALPGGVVPMVRRRCPAGDFSESRPASFGKLPFARVPCPLFSLNHAPAPLVGTDPIGRNRGVSETDTSAPFWKSFLSSQPLAHPS